MAGCVDNISARTKKHMESSLSRIKLNRIVGRSLAVRILGNG